jgi:hypothetical protein
MCSFIDVLTNSTNSNVNFQISFDRQSNNHESSAKTDARFASRWDVHLNRSLLGLTVGLALLCLWLNLGCFWLLYNSLLPDILLMDWIWCIISKYNR